MRCIQVRIILIPSKYGKLHKGDVACLLKKFDLDKDGKIDEIDEICQFILIILFNSFLL